MAGILVAGERFLTRAPLDITLLKKSGSGFTVINDANAEFLLDITTSSVTFHHRTIISDISNIPIVTVKSKGIGNDDSWVGIRGNGKKSGSSDVLFEASASRHKRPIIDIVLSRSCSADSELHARVVSLTPNFFHFASNNKHFANMNMQIDSYGKVEAMNIHLQEEHVDYVFVSSIAVIISQVYKDIARKAAKNVAHAIEEAATVADLVGSVTAVNTDALA